MSFVNKSTLIPRVPIMQKTLLSARKQFAITQKTNLKHTIARFSDKEIVETSKTLGDMIGLYVGLYCSMNWFKYRSLRKKIQDNNKK